MEREADRRRFFWKFKGLLFRRLPRWCYLCLTVGMPHRASGQWPFIFQDEVLPEPVTRLLESCVDANAFVWERLQHLSLHFLGIPGKYIERQKSGSGFAVPLADPVTRRGSLAPGSAWHCA